MIDSGEDLGMSDKRMKVLVKEKIGDSGIDLLREHFDVDLGVDWSDEHTAVPDTVVDEIVVSEGFVNGWSVDLS
jgi:hypothetical protein